MAHTPTAQKRQAQMPLIHGALELPTVLIDDYNNEARERGGFLGDRINKQSFQTKIQDARKIVRSYAEDPFDKTLGEPISKKKIDAMLESKDAVAMALAMGAVEDFSRDFADVVSKFLAIKAWAKTERIAVGGGFRDSRAGELAIARTMMILRAAGSNVTLVPIAHHPDEAGLIGSVHLMPSWMLKGHNAILAVDIGGTNMRAGIVEFDRHKNLIDDAKVTVSDIWRHADDQPSRSAAIARLVAMLNDLLEKAGKLKLAPLIGIACPGIVNPDGAIARGAHNLPGGNWESDHFNLPAAITKAIPTIGGHETFVMMHNDAVVQGLSQVPLMRDVSHWGVMTIGTGLGNARFTNRKPLSE
ncbi:ROK family protein [Rhizobium sp. CG5]|uniref:ROK family protein n=1 Tax=Rhizobium sp. CG5 TaxID=2726076 RepID=UPI00203336B8|nr:ROK family protein [Rhizobium sp. CG5]MCM2474374.1 ROK family protein [Rhizobium sp. CG5]